MRDDHSSEVPPAGLLWPPDLGHLTRRALDAVAERQRGLATGASDWTIAQFRALALRGTEDDLAEFVAPMLRAGVPADLIEDHFIPETARRLGEDWLSDACSFAEVTIGSARLQSALRALDRAGDGALPVMATGASVLLLVPEGEDHTIGAFVAARQLRRRGVEVALRINASVDDVLPEVMDGLCRAVLVSWGDSARIEALARVVARLRAACGEGMPVILGGAFRRPEGDLCKALGADLLADGIEPVLDLLNAPGAGQGRVWMPPEAGKRQGGVRP